MKTAAILLAAGRSVRMGRPKPLLPWGQTTVVQSCIVNLKGGGAGDIVVVVGAASGEVKTTLADSSVQIGLNELPMSEMSVSIARGVERVIPDCGAILIALVDQPFIPPEVIARIIETWQKTRAKIIIPEHNGRGGHPVLFDYSLATRLMNLDPSLGLRALIAEERNSVKRIPIESPLIIRDMDTMDDYVSLHEETFGYSPTLV